MISMSSFDFYVYYLPDAQVIELSMVSTSLWLPSQKTYKTKENYNYIKMFLNSF